MPEEPDNTSSIDTTESVDCKKHVIGWREIVAIPEWGVEHIDAKSDTGAATSAIDVTKIEELDADHVRFEVVLERSAHPLTKPVTAKISRKAMVRSSNGQQRERIFVMTKIKIGKITKEIEVSLVKRHRMKYRMLLGRSALEPDLIVDASLRHQLKPRRKRKQTKD